MIYLHRELFYCHTMIENAIGSSLRKCDVNFDMAVQPAILHTKASTSWWNWQAVLNQEVIRIKIPGLQVQIADNTNYIRLLIRLPFGLAESAAAKSAKSCPYMLLPLLFLLNNWLEFSSTDANVSSNSSSIDGQLSFKCKKASDCITTVQSKKLLWLSRNKNINKLQKGIFDMGIKTRRKCSKWNLKGKIHLTHLFCWVTNYFLLNFKKVTNYVFKI